jgi:Icc-related predicted phosphoesterase
MIHKLSDSGLKIHHISDTHNQQWDKLNIPSDTDILIHSGDATNSRDRLSNSVEWGAFVKWYESLPIPIKIFVPGNHDATCYFENKRVRDMCKDAGIEYLNKDSFSVYGLNFWGDAMTPEFGTWYFSAPRAKMAKHWDMIPDDTHILITHGPRKGHLDLSSMRNELYYCGCSALGTKIDKMEHLKLHCFGHIHDNSTCFNTGIKERNGIIYSNGAAVKDGEFGKGIHYHGNTFVL